MGNRHQIKVSDRDPKRATLMEKKRQANNNLVDKLLEFGDPVFRTLGAGRYSDAVEISIALWNMGLSSPDERGAEMWALTQRWAGVAGMNQELFYRWLDRRMRDFGADSRYIFSHELMRTRSGPSLSVRWVDTEAD